MPVSQVIDLKNTTAYVEVLKAYRDLCKKVNTLSDCKAASFVYVQGVPAISWSINHNLGFYPNATVVDSANDEVVGDIHYVDLNNILITFSGAFSGKAYLS